MNWIAKEPEKLLEDVMARHHYAGDALIEVLHAAQQFYGCLSAPVLKEIARKLRLPPSRVFGVATFYHLFHFTRPAKHCATVCVGTACYVDGAAELAHIAENNGWTVDFVRCVGSCGLAPLVVCDGAALPHATPAKLVDFSAARL
jgi:bidirectional [NiFe] hydrogenase diaphorase subunit